MGKCQSCVRAVLPLSEETLPGCHCQPWGRSPAQMGFSGRCFVLLRVVWERVWVVPGAEGKAELRIVALGGAQPQFSSCKTGVLKIPFCQNSEKGWDGPGEGTELGRV